MKLHLPKQLFTALLAALTLAAPAALTLGSAAWGDITSESLTLYKNDAGEISSSSQDGYTSVDVTMYTGSTSSGMTASNLTLGPEDDYLGFRLDQSGSTSGNWFSGNSVAITHNLIIYDDNTGDDTEKGLIINNGSGGQIITFSGNVYGNGVIKKANSAPGNGLTLKFTGDMSAFTGNIESGGNANDKLTFSGGKTGTGTITSVGNITFTDTEIYNSSISVTTDSRSITFDGSNTIKSSRLTISGSATNNGTLTVDSGASLSLASTLTNNGTLNLNGRVEANSVDGFQVAATGVGLNNNNGLLDKVSYVLASGSGSVTVADTAKLYLGEDTAGVEIAVNGNTAYFDAATDGSTYYVFTNTGTSEVKSGFGSSATGTIYLASGATLTSETNYKMGSAFTLVGSGTYNLGSQASSVDFDSNPFCSLSADKWTGTVVIKDATNIADLDFNKLGNANSAVQVIGVEGHLHSAAADYTSDIILGYLTEAEWGETVGRNGITFTDGYSNNLYTFSGAVKGTGNMTSKRASNHTTQIKFTGDVSSWTGSYVQDTKTTGATGCSTSLTFAGAANNVNAAITQTAGALNLTVETASNATFNKAVTVNNLTLKNNTTFNAALKVKGTATVEADKTLTLGKYVHEINALSMKSGSQVEAAFTESDKSVTVDSLTVANGVSTTLGTKQGGYHNGYFNIKQLKGVGSTLVLSNGSQTSLSTVFDLGSNQGEAAFSGTLTLQANNANANAAKRGLVVNIKNSGLLADTVLELKGTNTNVTERMGIGLDQDTTIGGIKDTPNNAPSNTYIQAGSFSKGYNMNTAPAASSGANEVTLTIATDTDYSTSANILNKVNLKKTGTGKQIFSGDMGAFTGDITVTGGTLSFTGTTNTMGGAVDADIDVTVTGEGSVLDLNNTSILDTATVGNGGTLSIGSGNSLTVNSGLTMGNGAQTIQNKGTLTLNGALNVAGLAGLTQTGSYSDDENGIFTGIFTVVDAGFNAGTGFSMMLDNEVISSSGEGTTYNIDNSTGALFITLSDDKTYWVNSNVAYDSTNPDMATEATAFHVKSGVTFDANGSALGKAVTLQAGATLTNSTTSAASVTSLELLGDATVNAANNSGHLNVSGTAGQLNMNGYTLTKTGAGYLNLSNVVISSGTLQIDGGRIVTENTVSQAEGAALNVVINNNALLHTKGSLTLENLSWNSSSSSELCLESADNTMTITGNLSATTNFKKTGDGTLTVNGAADFGADLRITKGTVNLAGETTFGGTINNDGTLNVTGSLTAGAITKTGTGTLILALGENKQKLTNITVNGGTLQITGYDMFNYGSSKTITVNGGGVLQLDERESVNANDKIVLSNGTISGTGGINENKGYTAGLDMYTNNAATPMVIEASGTSTISTGIAVRESNGRVKFDVGNENAGAGTHALTVSGAIQANGGIIKSGAGELILSGSNTYANGTTIEAGTVTTRNASALGTGSVTVNDTGVLRVAEDLKLQDTLQLNSSAQVQIAANKALNLQDKVILSSTDGTNDASMTAKSNDAQLVQLQQDASFTIEDMTLTNTTVTAATPTTQVNFDNATANGNFVLNVAAASQLVTPPTVGDGGTPVEGNLTYSYGLGLATSVPGENTITLNLDVVNAIAPSQSGLYTLVVELTNFDYEAFSGVTESTWAELVGFQEGSWVKEALMAPEVLSGEGGDVPSVSYGFASTGSNVGTLTITITGLNVPEPASATLGLAALMMLCARRRRKA